MQKINIINDILIYDYIYLGISPKKNNIIILRVKLFIIILIIIIILKLLLENPDYYMTFNNNKLSKILNIDFNIAKNIRIALYTKYIVNGGRARITAILFNYLYKLNIFTLFLFTSEKQKNEYTIPNDTKRIIINKNLFEKIKENEIDILIYQLTNVSEIIQLNKLKKVKVIFYHHSSVFDWIYFSYRYFKLIYKAFKQSKYVITIVPYENDYLFKKWGIKTILMNNFMTYEYNSITPSDLSSKTILMLGRGNDKKKRFELGIKAMQYIIKEIPEGELKIISTLKGIVKHRILVKKLDLEKNVRFVGYNQNPEIYFKNASLHFFPSISESFGLVLSEVKLYGIPSILLGLDYVSIAKGGTIIIYDDKPESLAKESIKILKNKKYRKKLGKEARRSIKKFNNKILILKWIKLIISVYKGDYYYESLRKQDIKIEKKEALNIIKNQIKLLKLRKKRFRNITKKQFENFTFMQNLK